MKKILLLTTFFLSYNCLVAQSWVQQNTGFTTASRGLSSINIIDANTVWGFAYDGSGAVNAPKVQEFTKTLNGGVTWTAGTIDIGNASWSINNLSPVNGTTAWVSAIDLSGGEGTPTPGGIWKTVNGGSTWTQQNTNAFVGIGAFINGVYFWDANEGIAFGDPVAGSKIECYRTTDGGATWTSVTTVPNMLTGEYNYNNGNVFVGNSIFLPTNKGKILKSTDKGLTWLRLSAPSVISDFGSVAVNATMSFSNASNGVMLGTSDSGATYKLYTTSNGGVSWITPTTNYAGGFNRLLTFVPGTSTIVACGLNATAPAIPGSSYSNDNGTTFTQIDTGAQRGVVTMLTNAVGWSAGFSALSASGASTGGIFKFNGSLSNSQFGTSKYFQISPNPSSGVVDLSGSIPFDSVVVYDLVGKVVFKRWFTADKLAQIDLTKLQAGTYLVKITSETTSETLKILKQ